MKLAAGNTSYDTFDEEGEGEGEMIEGDCRDNGRFVKSFLSKFES